VRVRLKGINKVTATLASGERVTYWYAWKGGPRLPGQPGSPEFVAAYQSAVMARRAPAADTLHAILDAYQRSSDFAALAERTRADYVKQVRKIEVAFGDFPLAALDDRRSRAEFMAWRDRLAIASRRQADYAWTVLARVLSWGKDRGLITTNPCERGGRLYAGNRAEKVWTLDDEAAFLRAAPAHLHPPLLLALWTGQRQGDLLRLPWSAYDGQTIRLRQGKTGRRVVVPCGAPLRAVLDAMPRRAPLVLLTKDGSAWTEEGFRASWRKAVARAGIEGVTFNDLRGTAVTRLALAGATEAEIATITGHALRDVRSILDAHYLNRDPELAARAIAKLEASLVFPNGHPNGPSGSKGEKRGT
jgi:integrase